MENKQNCHIFRGYVPFAVVNQAHEQVCVLASFPGVSHQAFMHVTYSTKTASDIKAWGDKPGNGANVFLRTKICEMVHKGECLFTPLYFLEMVIHNSLGGAQCGHKL